MTIRICSAPSEVKHPAAYTFLITPDRNVYRWTTKDACTIHLSAVMGTIDWTPGVHVEVRKVHYA